MSRDTGPLLEIVSTLKNGPVISVVIRLAHLLLMILKISHIVVLSTISIRKLFH